MNEILKKNAFHTARGRRCERHRNCAGGITFLCSACLLILLLSVAAGCMPAHAGTHALAELYLLLTERQSRPERSFCKDTLFGCFPEVFSIKDGSLQDGEREVQPEASEDPTEDGYEQAETTGMDHELHLLREEMSLEGKLLQALEGKEGVWSVYVRDLKTGEVTGINEHQPVYAASLIKLFTMGIIFDMMASGQLERTETISGSLDRMITVSDNWSFNYLTDQAGLERLNRWIAQHGFTDTIIVHGLEPANNAGEIGVPMEEGNMTSAADCGRLLEMIWAGELASPFACQEMLGMMMRQESTYKIPQRLPDHAKTANKTGETTDTNHDAAIVWTKDSAYVLVVMSQLEDYGNSQLEAIRDLSDIVFSYQCH